MSNQQEMLDAEKDMSLQEITDLVQRIQKEINERKVVLAPEILKLKEMREDQKELNQKYTVQKRKYDDIVS